MPTRGNGRETIERRNAADVPLKDTPQHSILTFLATALIVVAFLFALMLFFAGAPSNHNSNPLPETRVQPG